MIDQPISQIIRARIANVPGSSCFANVNISEYITPEEREQLKVEVEGKVQDLLTSLIIDLDKDHNTRDTAARITRMYVDEVFRGRYHPKPAITSFPNASRLSELYVLGPLTVRSSCSHHFVPVIGNAWIGLVPADQIVGISKLRRILDWIMRRPHIQEEAAVMLADTLEKAVSPEALGVVIKAQHLCMQWRGVEEPCTALTTSVMRGRLRTDHLLREEFFKILSGQGFQG